MWLVKGLTAHVLATSFFSKIQPWNPQTQSHGSNRSWSGQAAVPIPEDYALTSYLYVHIAYRHVSMNYPEAQLEANSLEASFNSYFTFNIPAMNKSFPLFSFERYMPTSFHQFHYISLSHITSPITNNAGESKNWEWAILEKASWDCCYGLLFCQVERILWSNPEA